MDIKTKFIYIHAEIELSVYPNRLPIVAHHSIYITQIDNRQHLRSTDLLRIHTICVCAMCMYHSTESEPVEL